MPTGGMSQQEGAVMHNPKAAGTDLEHNHETRGQGVDDASNDPDDNGCPRVHSRGAGSDSHQTRQRGIAHRHDVPVVLASLHLEQDSSQKEACEPGGSGGQGGRHSCIGDSICIEGGAARSADNSQLATRVEPIPAKPKDHDSQDKQRGVVSSHVHRLRQEASLRQQSVAAKLLTTTSLVHGQTDSINRSVCSSTRATLVRSGK